MLTKSFQICPLANFAPIMRMEMKAFMGINITMGIVELPDVAMYWSSDDYFGNRGIKKVTCPKEMSK